MFYSSLTDFQDFSGPVAFFQDFPVLENAQPKFQDFSGFPGPVRTLVQELLLHDHSVHFGVCTRNNF